MKSKSAVLVLGLLLASTCIYAQKGKNITKNLGTQVSRKVSEAVAKTSRTPRVPTTPRTPVTRSTAVTPATARVPLTFNAAEIVEKEASERPSWYPSKKIRQKFLAHWETLTFGQQLADWKAFEEFYRKKEREDLQSMQSFRVRSVDTDPLMQEYNMRYRALSPEQKEIDKAMTIASQVKSPEAFDTQMEYYLIEQSPQMRKYMHSVLWDGSNLRKALISNRTQVLKRAGNEGSEHTITPQEQTEYAQAIRKILDPSIRMSEQMRSLWNGELETLERLDLAPKSVMDVAHRIEPFNIPIIIGGKPATIPCFVNRQTGDLGLVFELPALITISDGVNPPQVLDPQTQVIFFAADPFAKQMVYVEERAKFEDPYAYNLISPRPEVQLSAEQPVPAHAGQPSDPEAYAQIKEKVSQYRQKYYNSK